MVNEGVAWPIIFILAFTLPLAGPLSDPKSGITAFMLEMLQPLFGSGSGTIFVLCMGIVAVIMTQFINNTALAVALMPVVHTYCSTNGVSSELPVILITIACCLAFLTPAASSTAAMLHGNDWTNTKSIWKIAPFRALAHRCERGGHPHRQGIPVADPALPLLFQKQGQAPITRAWPCVSRNPSLE